MSEPTGTHTDRAAPQPSHGDWEKAKTRRDMYARLAALAALDGRTDDAKAYARSMIDSETVMNRTATALDQYPIQGAGQ